MHDVINASIANQRVRELVESGETRRTVRDRKRRREAAKPVRPVARRVEGSGVTPALLRILRGVM
jgi:hypothetical protein